MTAADFAPITQVIIDGVALVLTTLIGIYVPRGIAAFDRRTGIHVTDQQIAAVVGAATTEVGIIKLKLAQGLITLDDIKPDGPAIEKHAAAAIDRVPVSAAAINKSVPSMAETITGMLGNTSRPP
jgi:hypothetical protein